MFFDFVEVGTSDFDALIQNASDTTVGLSIDPVSHYLDRLPSPARCQKLNAAVSNKEGEVSVYFVRPELIKKLGLPDWIRGCNSIGEPHPSVTAVIKDKGLPSEVVVESRVPVHRLHNVLKMFNASGVYFLKIDTEGHDATILNDFFDAATIDLYPYKLLFESNVLSDNEDIHRLIARLILLGYDIVKSETGGAATDTLLRLNISRLPKRSRFTAGLPNYYLSGYPAGYEPLSPPHANALEDAQRYCLETMQGGVTFQYGRYEVRKGCFVDFHNGYPGLMSWVLVP